MQLIWLWMCEIYKSLTLITKAHQCIFFFFYPSHLCCLICTRNNDHHGNTQRLIHLWIRNLFCCLLLSVFFLYALPQIVYHPEGNTSISSDGQQTFHISLNVCCWGALPNNVATSITTSATGDTVTVNNWVQNFIYFGKVNKYANSSLECLASGVDC